MSKISFLKVIALFLLSFVTVQSSTAQNGNIRGFVYDFESGEPVIFTSVILKGTSYGAQTDVNGYFSISKLKPDNYVIQITMLGHDTLLESVTLKANEILTKKLYLKKSTVNLKVIEISAEKKEQTTEVRTSVTKITPQDMKRIPSVGGEPDIAQYMQVLPGVVFTGDQGGQLYIRGGAPVQNKVLLDGMIIYNPFHSIGLFSVFDADYIRNADVYTGGFGAQYGGRISSIMDITTRDGNKKRLSGKIGATTFGSKILLEGPIKKAKDEHSSTSSFILSYKNSYLKQSSKLFYNYIDSAGLPFNFNDFYGKISLNSPNGSKVNIFGFNFNDQVNYNNITNINWVSSGVGSNFIVIPGGSPVLIEGNFAYSNYNVSMDEGNSLPNTSRINGFNFGLNFTYFIQKNEINYGLDILGFKTDFEYYSSRFKITQEENTSELAGYLKYKHILGKLILDPSLRLHYYATLQEVSPEPRIGIKYNLTDNFRLKASAGRYSQNLIAANSDRDVVNLFYGFLSGPDNLPKSFVDRNGKVKEINSKLQLANHYIAGFEIDITNNISLNVEAYNKQYTQLSNLNRNKIFDDVADNFNKPDTLKKDFIIENGFARGLDFLVKYDYKRLYIWAVYSIGYVRRWDGQQEYIPHFDRRHNINLVASYIFGKGLNWSVDARWNFGSGFPFTQTQGFYELLDFQGNLNADYTTANGNMGILYGQLNSKRLPTFHRLDISVKRKFPIGENAMFEAHGGITNVYNRNNVFYFNRITNKVVHQLPFMPSVGLNLSF
ncbi:MAG: TonB-dependent receptor [Bacteroidia bacterium]|nr:TonB-dependent receptor [Bacteroidia bacterium]MCZ2248264.1 TonB-dependent receptor [Bacteroidia bacterium]